MAAKSKEVSNVKDVDIRYELARIGTQIPVDEFGIPEPRVRNEDRPKTDVEFKYGYWHCILVKVIITYLLLSLNNSYGPQTSVTHPENCTDFTCTYNHTDCSFGKANVMVKTSLLSEEQLPKLKVNQTDRPEWSTIGECKKPCNDGFQYIGFQTICIENSFDQSFLQNCSENGDNMLAQTEPWNAFSLTVMQVSLQQRIFFGKVLATVFGIATVWGIGLRFFPKFTLILTVMFEAIGACLTGVFLHLQTGRTTVLLLFFTGTAVLLLLTFATRRFLIMTWKYLECAKECLSKTPEIFAWTFLNQFFILVYAVGYTFVIRASFYILFPIADGGTECTLKPPFLVLMAWGFSGIIFLWTVLLFRQINRGMTSGAVALWYLHRTDFTVRITTAEANVSMKWAMTSSFGSYAVMAVILPLVEFIRIVQGRFGKKYVLRFLMLGTGKSLSELVEILDSHATAMHAISALDITHAARAFHGLLEKESMRHYLTLGSDARRVFQVIAAAAGFSVGTVVFINLIYQYGVLDSLSQSSESPFSVTGFGLFSILFMAFASYFPKATLLCVSFDSAIRYGSNHGTEAMFTTSLCAAALTSAMTDYMSDPIVQALETMLVCNALQKNKDASGDAELTEQILFSEVMELNDLNKKKGLVAFLSRIFSKKKKGGSQKYKVRNVDDDGEKPVDVSATDDVKSEE